MRSLFFEKVREYGPRLARIAGWGTVTLLISAVLIAFRIMACDETDIIWDHPSMFPEVVRMAYSPDSRSEWGPVWDMFFLVVPLWVYVGVFVPRLWEPEQDEYAAYRGSYWEDLKRLAPPEPPPYLEYELVETAEAPIYRSRTPTLRGFPAPRPPAEPAERSTPSQEEIDKGWEELAK